MPLYKFRVAEGRGVQDLEQLELPGDELARLEAIRLAGEMMRDYPARLCQDGEWRIEVVDEQGVSRFAVLALATDVRTGDA